MNPWYLLVCCFSLFACSPDGSEGPKNAQNPTSAQADDVVAVEGAFPPPSAVFGQGPPDLPVGVEVIPTDSGLRYAIIHPGGGSSPQAGQEVEVHYTGWLEANGARFDSSVDRGQPLRFVIGQKKVIAGWDEGVLGMKLNEKRRLFVPAALAYGDRGAGQTIPPGAALVFDVELLAIH